jgi:hypothetical protein
VLALFVTSSILIGADQITGRAEQKSPLPNHPGGEFVLGRLVYQLRNPVRAPGTSQGTGDQERREPAIRPRHQPHSILTLDTAAPGDLEAFEFGRSWGFGP